MALPTKTKNAGGVSSEAQPWAVRWATKVPRKVNVPLPVAPAKRPVPPVTWKVPDPLNRPTQAAHVEALRAPRVIGKGDEQVALAREHEPVGRPWHAGAGVKASSPGGTLAGTVRPRADASPKSWSTTP